jgi:hypothetical protein
MPDDPNLQTPAPTPAATPEPAPPAAASNPGPPAGDPPLGPAGESALRAERARATQLERQLAEERRTRTEGVGQDQQTLERQLAEERRLRLEAERRGESAEERARREQEERDATSRQRHAEGTTRLQEANTLLALQDQGLAGSQARAAVRLVDGIEYDAEGRPTNLEARLTAAKAVYGEVLGGATPPPQPAPQPAGHVPGLPNVPLHHGPRQPAQLSEDEMHARAMKNVFPQAAFANGTDPD